MFSTQVNGVLTAVVSDETGTGQVYCRVQGRSCRSCGSPVAYEVGGHFLCTGGCGEIDEADVVRVTEAAVD